MFLFDGGVVGDGFAEGDSDGAGAVDGDVGEFVGVYPVVDGVFVAVYELGELCDCEVCFLFHVFYYITLIVSCLICVLVGCVLY